MPWDPSQYLKFGDYRLRPAVDLLNRIDAEAPADVFDLGCGAGNVTRLLRARWPQARITGVDSSDAMLARAASIAPDVEWLQADLASWEPPRRAGVIYSNAALHWLSDHPAMLVRLLGALRPGGTLAVQMPRNFTAPSHTLIAKAALAGPWRKMLEPLLRPPPVAEPAFYFDLLSRRASTLDMWETEYLHVLEGEDPVKEWTKGSWLSPLLDALREPERSQFERCYADMVAEAYPRRPDGKTLLPFRRLFIVATV